MEQSWASGNSPRLLIIIKKAFHTVLSAPPLNLHAVPSHMHTYTGASLEVTLPQMLAVAVFASECQLLSVNSRVLGGFAHSV